MGGILRPIQGLQQIQTCITHYHTGKIWRTPKTLLINQTHVQKIVFKLIIGKIEISIEFKVGVKQGYSMAPLLFLFLVMAFDETLEYKRSALVLSKAQFSCKDNLPRSTGQLMIHQPGTFTSGTLFDIFCMIYVDASLFVFESSTNNEKGITLLFDHFAWFGIEMHIGTKEKPRRRNFYSSCLQVSSSHEHYHSLNSPTPLWPSRKKKAIKRDAHMRTKYITSA